MAAHVPTGLSSGNAILPASSLTAAPVFLLGGMVGAIAEGRVTVNRGQKARIEACVKISSRGGNSPITITDQDVRNHTIAERWSASFLLKA
jgi:hypothetical protein